MAIEPPSFAYDFFLSRRGSVAATAQEVADMLEGEGYRVPVQDYDFASGGQFVADIDDALKQARDLLVLYGRDYASPTASHLFGAGQPGTTASVGPRASPMPRRDGSGCAGDRPGWTSPVASSPLFASSRRMPPGTGAKRERARWFLPNRFWCTLPCATGKRRQAVSIIQAHIHIAPDGTITGSAPGAAPGEHDAAIILQQPPRSSAARSEMIAAIREIQETVAKLPVLDPGPPDVIIGYDENGLPT